MKIIDGKSLSEKIKSDLKEKLQNEKFKSIPKPHLVVIQVGDDPASNLYINNKKKACEEVGIKCSHYQYKEEVTTEHLKNIIRKLSLTPTVTGIMIQLPLPDHIDEQAIIDEIDPIKDVDGFTRVQAGMLQLGINDKNRLLPCTAKGIIRLLESVTTLEGKDVVVVGRSNIVGKPLAQLLQEKNATVTLCHSKTRNLEWYTRNSDIIILATGKPEYFNSRYFYGCENIIIIDAGINRNKNDKLCGDLNVEDVQDMTYASSYQYTPVPGGVGPMTVAELLDNIYIAYENQFDNIWNYYQNRQIANVELNKPSKIIKYISLGIPETITNLIWDELGQYICKYQILPKIDLEKKNIIYFPKNIKAVSITFIEGLVNSVPVHRKDFYKYFSIEGNDKIVNKFRDIISIGDFED